MTMLTPTELGWKAQIVQAEDEPLSLQRSHFFPNDQETLVYNLQVQDDGPPVGDEESRVSTGRHWLCLS